MLTSCPARVALLDSHFHHPVCRRRHERLPGQVHYLAKLHDQGWPGSSLTVSQKYAKICGDTFRQTTTSWPRLGGYLGLALATNDTFACMADSLVSFATGMRAKAAWPSC